MRLRYLAAEEKEVALELVQTSLFWPLFTLEFFLFAYVKVEMELILARTGRQIWVIRVNWCQICGSLRKGSRAKGRSNGRGSVNRRAKSL